MILILILISIIVAAIVCAALLAYGATGFHTRHFIARVGGLLLAVATGISAVTYSLALWHWVAADSKAQIINREYGTQYTREEVFYASDVIDTIRNINRKRIEINGDLLHSKEQK